MAVILTGLSECPICNRTLEEGEAITGFSHFITNLDDPVALFTDAAFHTACLAAHPLGKKAQQLDDQSYEVFRARKCVVTGETISNWNDQIYFSVLCSDEAEPLSAFNFTMLHKKNVKQWKDFDRFIAVAEDFLRQGKWRSIMKDRNGLQMLIDELNAAFHDQ